MTKCVSFFGRLVAYCVIPLWGIPSLVLATDHTRLEKLHSDINSVTQDMERIQRERDEMQSSLVDVEQKYGEAASVLRDLQKQVDDKRTSLEKIPLEISKLERQIAKFNIELSEQIRAAYFMGEKARLKLILNQQDPALSSRMMVYYDYFNKSRLTKLAFVEESVKRLDTLREQKQHDTELLEQSLKQKKVEQITLDQIRRERNVLLSQLNDDFNSKEQRLKWLKDNEQKLTELFSTLDDDNQFSFEAEPESEEDGMENVESDQSFGDSSSEKQSFTYTSGEFASLKGKLPLPVQGELADSFGKTNAQGMTSHGILIKAQEGTDIHAVTKGRVAYAGPFQGYGQLMILEHGDGYMTLYAFNQSLYKKKGELVDKGEVIASVGQSGGRSQPGLYFEVRKDSKPVNPLAWCH